jgi:hypothetical protein
MSFAWSVKNLSRKRCMLQEENDKEEDQQKDGSLFDTKQTNNNKSNL